MNNASMLLLTLFITFVICANSVFVVGAIEVDNHLDAILNNNKIVDPVTGRSNGFVRRHSSELRVLRQPKEDGDDNDEDEDVTSTSSTPADIMDEAEDVLSESVEELVEAVEELKEMGKDTAAVVVPSGKNEIKTTYPEFDEESSTPSPTPDVLSASGGGESEEETPTKTQSGRTPAPTPIPENDNGDDNDGVGGENDEGGFLTFTNSPTPVNDGPPDEDGSTPPPTPSPIEDEEGKSPYGGDEDWYENETFIETPVPTPYPSFGTPGGSGGDEWGWGGSPWGGGKDYPTDEPTPRPTVLYVPKGGTDPLAEEIEPDEKDFTDDSVLYHGLGGTVGEYLDGVESPEELVKDKNVEVTAGILGALFFVLILVTAHLVMNYPDGLCAGCCRLTLKIICCFTRTLCLPCRAICCRGSEQSQSRRTHAPMRTPFPTDLELA